MLFVDVNPHPAVVLVVAAARRPEDRVEGHRGVGLQLARPAGHEPDDITLLEVDHLPVLLGDLLEENRLLGRSELQLREVGPRSLATNRIDARVLPQEGLARRNEQVGSGHHRRISARVNHRRLGRDHHDRCRRGNRRNDHRWWRSGYRLAGRDNLVAFGLLFIGQDVIRSDPKDNGAGSSERVLDEEVTGGGPSTSND